jgi:hypothetical protein
VFIASIDRETLDLSHERPFYTQILGFPLQQATADPFSVQASTTALTFGDSGAHPALLPLRLHRSSQQVDAGQSLAPGQSDAA